MAAEVVSEHPKKESPRLGWTYAPLIAFAVVLSPMLFLYFIGAALEAFAGRFNFDAIAEHFYGVVVISLIFAGANWAFLALFW